MQANSTNARLLVAVLASSIAGYTALNAEWRAEEGFTSEAVIPTRGDVPTIGHGSTRYEDGSRVKMTDTITRERAEVLAVNLMTQDAKAFAATLPADVRLHPAEFKVYMKFVGQFGAANWRKSSMRSNIIKGDYTAACHALLLYRYSAGYDCSSLVDGRPNKVCYGVWTRQQQRHRDCMAAQS